MAKCRQYVGWTDWKEVDRVQPHIRVARGEIAKLTRVTVREAMPPCRHEKAVECEACWCSECGAYRHWAHPSRWRKPRRA